jgi:hypothetical protein
LLNILHLKRYILFCVLTVAVIGAKAQAGYNYYEFGVGGGASYTRAYTNLKTETNNFAYNLNFIYNYNPYLPIEAEFQIGKLSGGGLDPKVDKDGRQYVNNFKALVLHADVQLGSFIDYGNDWFLNAVKNFYLGSGIGLISNNNTVQRYSIYKPAPPDPNAYRFPGSDKSINVMVPLRVGYEFKIFDSYDEPGWAIGVGYVHNLVFGEGLDGYDDPTQKFKNNATNQYRQITISFKYFFGNTVSYNKLVKDYGF